MKKITKIESARIIENQGGNCNTPINVDCDFCFNRGNCDKWAYLVSEPDKKEDATAYIKRYGKKSVETRPVFMKAIKEQKEFCVYGEYELLNILIELSGIKRSRYFENTTGIKFRFSSTFPKKYMVWSTACNPYDLPEYHPDTDSFDDLVTKAEKQKEPELQPISIDDLRKMMHKEGFVYYFDTDEHIGRLNMKHVHEITIDGDCIAMKLTEKVTAKNYYRTLSDAVKVAEKQWGIE